MVLRIVYAEVPHVPQSRVALVASPLERLLMRVTLVGSLLPVSPPRPHVAAACAPIATSCMLLAVAIHVPQSRVALVASPLERLLMRVTPVGSLLPVSPPRPRVAAAWAPIATSCMLLAVAITQTLPRVILVTMPGWVLIWPVTLVVSAHAVSHRGASCSGARAPTTILHVLLAEDHH